MKREVGFSSFCLVGSLLLFGFLLVAVDVVVAQDGGEVFITQREEFVVQIASQAKLNHGDCALLTNCEASCSRAVCYPQKEDQQADCAQVELTEFCSPTASNKTCDRFMKLNYLRSYVTLPPPGTPEDRRSEEVRDICLQSGLDGTFKNMSKKTLFSYVFFGSATGPFRAFPGRERETGKCKAYQTRFRPWYKNGISVQKQLKILVDTGNSMGSRLPVDYPPDAGSTSLEVVSNILLSMLKTVSPDDFLDIATFNSTGHYQLTPQVQISSKFDEFENSTELTAVEDSVKSLSRSTPGLSNLTAAILTAVETFRDEPKDTLKVIVIFTNGDISPLNITTFPIDRTLGMRVKIILYKLSLHPEDDPYLLKTTLPDVICSVNGTFEVLDPVYSVGNPLYAIRSYYTFMAKTQLAVVNNQPTWSGQYLSYSQPLNGTSVTYPAFDSNDQLIGVAGIDIYPDKLSDSQKELVYRALQTRTAKGSMPAPAAKINLECNYQKAAKINDEGCGRSASVTNGGICPATDLETSLQQRVCCRGCLPSTPSKNILPYVLGGVAAGLGLILVALCIRCYRGSPRPRRPPIGDPPTIPDEYRI